MARDAILMSGIILITGPTIQYGGYFLLTSPMNKGSGYMGQPTPSELLSCGTGSCRRDRDCLAHL
jgi:hypothetical protein